MSKLKKQTLFLLQPISYKGEFRTIKMKIVAILLLSALTNSVANSPGGLKPLSKTSTGKNHLLAIKKRKRASPSSCAEVPWLLTKENVPPTCWFISLCNLYFFYSGCSRKTEYGDCCHLPFVYRGNTYHGCTTDGWHREWCSLTANYNNDFQWGNFAGKTFDFLANF